MGAAPSNGIRLEASSQSEMLSLANVQLGDLVVRTDMNNTLYQFYRGNNSAAISNWRVVGSSGSANLLVSDNTFSGNNTFNGNVSYPATSMSALPAIGNFMQLVVDSNGNVRTQPSSVSLGGTLISVAPMAAPPDSPTYGDRYLVPSNATGVWSTHTNQIAQWNGAAWAYYTPKQGDIVRDISNNGRSYSGTYPTGTWATI